MEEAKVSAAPKQGKVLLVGRPNVGKSTFVNNLIGQKVAITSPKPQTTRFQIRALYEDERGQIVFVDTPGIFAKANDLLSKKINKKTLSAINEEVDVVVYMVDPTRKRDYEEGKVLGLVRKLKDPKILVVNKMETGDAHYLPQYKFMEEEFKDVFYISALHSKHFRPLLDKIFEYLPAAKAIAAAEKGSPEAKKAAMDTFAEIRSSTGHPLLNLDSKTFIAELVREKIFLMMGEEIPYTTTVVVDDIIERTKNLTYIKARILTTNDRYKMMIIGREGRKIKELGSYARKEIALATDKKIFLDLTVVTDPHWQETYYS